MIAQPIIDQWKAMDVKVYNLKSEVDAEYHFASLSLLHKLGRDKFRWFVRIF